MNDRDDQALHELLLAWEEPPPEEAATQRLLDRLSEQLKQAPGRSGRWPFKERCPLWPQKRWVWGTVGIILALEGVFAWNRLPPKYQTPRHVLPADNGYLDFIAAGDQIKAIDEKLRQRNPYDRGSGPRLTWAEAQALAAQVRPALERARRGLSRPHIVPPHETYTAATLFPYLSPLCDLARQSMLLADVQLVRGDRTGALDTYLLVLEVGEQVKHGPLLHHLMGMAIQAITVGGLVNSPLAAELGLPVQGPSVYDAHRLAWQGEMRRAEAVDRRPDWAAAAERLRRLQGHRVPLREAMELEREAALNIAFEVLSSRTPEEELEDLAGGGEWIFYWLVLQAGLINRRQEFREIAAFYDKLLASIDRGRWDEPDIELTCRRNLLLGLLVPDYRPAYNRVNLSHTLLALLEMQCRAAAGEELAPPEDPFAPGQPLRRRGKVFYSVGLDGRDDGGTPLESRELLDPDARGDISLLSSYKPFKPPKPAIGGPMGGTIP